MIYEKSSRVSINYFQYLLFLYFYYYILHINFKAKTLLSYFAIIKFIANYKLNLNYS